MIKVLPIGIMAVVTLVITLAYFKLWEGYDASRSVVTAPIWGGVAYLVAVLLLVGIAFVGVVLIDRVFGR